MPGAELKLHDGGLIGEPPISGDFMDHGWLFPEGQREMQCRVALRPDHLLITNDKQQLQEMICVTDLKELYVGPEQKVDDSAMQHYGIREADGTWHHIMVRTRSSLQAGTKEFRTALIDMCRGRLQEHDMTHLSERFAHGHFKDACNDHRQRVTRKEQVRAKQGTAAQSHLSPHVGSGGSVDEVQKMFACSQCEKPVESDSQNFCTGCGMWLGRQLQFNPTFVRRSKTNPISHRIRQATQTLGSTAFDPFGMPENASLADRVERQRKQLHSMLDYVQRQTEHTEKQAHQLDILQACVLDEVETCDNTSLVLGSDWSDGPGALTPRPQLEGADAQTRERIQQQRRDIEDCISGRYIGRLQKESDELEEQVRKLRRWARAKREGVKKDRRCLLDINQFRSTSAILAAGVERMHRQFLLDVEAESFGHLLREWNRLRESHARMALMMRQVGSAGVMAVAGAAAVRAASRRSHVVRAVCVSAVAAFAIALQQPPPRTLAPAPPQKKAPSRPAAAQIPPPPMSASSADDRECPSPPPAAAAPPPPATVRGPSPLLLNSRRVRWAQRDYVTFESGAAAEAPAAAPDVAPTAAAASCDAPRRYLVEGRPSSRSTRGNAASPDRRSGRASWAGQRLSYSSSPVCSIRSPDRSTTKKSVPRSGGRTLFAAGASP
eukprot:TRINITY_DN2917_c0_g1_i3.p1 TRINITY_DN2917_c0_g1~~TRINITY_DN2917_c0_g1_i3.p1  ORF type:complete len:681 (+),score=187.76 TRINITY_DN2917_c0_g1_i3:50-2044(+)